MRASWRWLRAGAPTLLRSSTPAKEAAAPGRQGRQHPRQAPQGKGMWIGAQASAAAANRCAASRQALSARRASSIAAFPAEAKRFLAEPGWQTQRNRRVWCGPRLQMRPDEPMLASLGHTETNRPYAGQPWPHQDRAAVPLRCAFLAASDCAPSASSSSSTREAASGCVRPNEVAPRAIPPPPTPPPPTPEEDEPPMEPPMPMNSKLLGAVLSAVGASTSTAAGDWIEPAEPRHRVDPRLKGRQKEGREVARSAWRVAERREWRPGGGSGPWPMAHAMARAHAQAQTHHARAHRPAAAGRPLEASPDETARAMTLGAASLR